MGSLGETFLRDAESVRHADKTLYSSDRTLIVRRHLPGQDRAVIVKQAIGAETIRRLRHESAILERLHKVPGVVQIVGTIDQANALTLHDDDGTPLTEVLKTQQLGLLEVVELGLALCGVLAGVHRAGVIHKDINPSNILVSGPTLQPTLIDFNISSSVAEERPGFTHQSHIAGTLAYMSPEQTGRTGRAVDQRADLYSLGVTLYELATGRKPFESDDLLELVRDQLVRVPIAPAAIQPKIPLVFSDLIMRLLEKEPDHRYQSADGLAQDLARVRDAIRQGDATPFVLGQHDFALRLMPPSRLIGRDNEISILRDTVNDCIDGDSRGLLVAGAPGVGKSALINELRPMVTARRGWFVSCKFNQYRQDGPSAGLEALRALGRLLLAEPEDQLALHRERILKGLGSNIGFGPSLLPEFVLLLGKHPRVEVTDPQEAEARMVQATIDLLRSIASAERPVIMVHDDIQWAPPISMRCIDAAITSSESIPGLLMVSGYRTNEIDAAHPLSAMLARWNALGMAPPQLLLNNLPPSDASALIGEMLRLPAEQASELSEALNERTEGNPYDTVELINALRQDGLLAPRDGLWDWDATAIRNYVGDAGVVDLLSRRIARLPDETRGLLEVMACLGVELSPAMLELCVGLDTQELQRHLAPSLEEGLLVTEQRNDTLLRFRHDRVQQAVFESMDAEQRNRRHLQLARRLAQQPEFATLAAEQYLPVIDSVTDEAEQRRMVKLFHRAAGRLGVLNYAVTERFLTSAAGLLKAVETPADASLLTLLEIERHQALYGLGRLDEADVAYASIVDRCSDPMDLVGPAGAQMDSLTHRSRYPEAVALGLKLLAELGLPKPADSRAAIGAGFQRLAKWQSSSDRLSDMDRPVVEDPRVLAWARVIIKTANAAYFGAPATACWLILESHRLWVEHGPCAQLMAGVGCLPYLQAASMPQGQRAAYETGRHLVAVGQARGFDHGTSVAGVVFALAAGHWVEPLENLLAFLPELRESMIRAGDLSYACHTYVSYDLVLECAPTLDPVELDIESCLALTARSGNVDQQHRAMMDRQMVRALRGETRSAGAFDDDTFVESECLRVVEKSGACLTKYHITRSLAAAVFGDTAALAHHTAQAMPTLSRLPGQYLTVLAYVLYGVALSEKAQALPLDERAAVLKELDETCVQWLTARAADAPMNFLHLQRWLEAESAWAAGNAWAAGATFDTAMREAAQRSRPWHHALITERAALFHLAFGVEQSGRRLLAQACELYEVWGAAGKVSELRRVYAFLRKGTSSLRRAEAGVRSTTVATDVVDMMAVLRASQALSSETSLSRLTDRVGMVLSAMTGATSVQLLVRPDDSPGWFMSRSLGDGASAAVSVEEAGLRGELPLSVFRYAERTGTVLLLDDATRDDRFAADPYIARLEQCSMLLAPIFKQGLLRAMLVLESRNLRSAFTAERLDAVTLIAGQLSVSLDNALLYASLERKVAERTAALEEANQRLELLSHTDALTGVANRRRFNEALESEWRRALRSQEPLGLVILDIDFFKKYNDTYGHQGGDTCLQRVASALNVGRRRGSDLVARYGGEEFVLLLPNTDVQSAFVVAERVRAAVQALDEPHLASSHAIVTISAGVASWVPTPDAKPADLVNAADAALYDAKREGRNRVALQRLEE